MTARGRTISVGRDFAAPLEAVAGKLSREASEPSNCARGVRVRLITGAPPDASGPVGAATMNAAPISPCPPTTSPKAMARPEPPFGRLPPTGLNRPDSRMI